MSKHRIQFDLTLEALEHLEALKEKAHASTPAEVVRNALRLYAWYLSRKEEGYQLVLRKGNELTDIQLFLW